MILPAYDISMYEYDDEKDIKSYGVLLCDVVHGKPPFHPLYLSTGWYWEYYGIRYAAGYLHLPTTHGWESRFINGYPYITAIKTTPKEAKEREPIFRERIKPFLEDFNSIYHPLRDEMMKLYDNAKKSRKLDKWDDIKNLRNDELLSFFIDHVYNINRRQSETHMLTMVPSFYISGLFQQLWKNVFGKDAPIDPLFQKLMSGFDTEIFRENREIWRLGQLAKELKLSKLFESNKNKEILQELKASEAGKKWLAKYDEFLKKYGWRCERSQEWCTPAWIEKPELGFPSIKVSMAKEVYTLDQQREQLIKDREIAEKEVLSTVPVSQRDWFGILMKAAVSSGYWSEDHAFYMDFYVSAMGRWIAMEFGRRFAENGCIDDPEDVHFLEPGEILKAAIALARVNLRSYVDRRKKAFQEAEKFDPPPFYGDISLADDIIRNDPTLSVSTQHPIVREELKADLYGAAAAPGIVEGIAHVIMTVDKLGELSPGEILVAPGTTVSWTPAFNIIKGLVVDGGGALSHPVIVAREYGIPCVAGCFEGTAKIKTGMRIKVDGNQGIVYIIGK